MNKRSGPTWSITYHIERRLSCPQIHPEGMPIEKAVRDRLISGDRLIAQAGDTTPDATVNSRPAISGSTTRQSRPTKDRAWRSSRR
jgi:hypothetical protein